MIDQHKMYNKINWIVFFVFALSSMLIMIYTNIEIREVANGFYIVNPKHILKYFINEMPLIFLYPIVQFTNDYLYDVGYYRIFINRRNKDVRI